MFINLPMVVSTGQKPAAHLQAVLFPIISGNFARFALTLTIQTILSLLGYMIKEVQTVEPVGAVVFQALMLTAMTLNGRFKARTHAIPAMMVEYGGVPAGPAEVSAY